MLHSQSILRARIFLAIVICIEHIYYYILDFHRFFSPQEAIINIETLKQIPNAFSFFNNIQNPEIVKCVLILGIPLYFFNACFQNRFLTIITYIYFFNIHQRNLFFNFGFDLYLGVLLFWTIFLPKVKSNENRFIKSPGTVILVFQIGVIYLINAISKVGLEWISGDAVRIAVADFQIRHLFSSMIYKHQFLAIILNYFIVSAELLIAILLLFFTNDVAKRKIASYLILVIHLGIALCMDVGFFLFSGITAALFIYPKEKIYNDLNVVDFWTRVTYRKLISIFICFFILYQSLILMIISSDKYINIFQKLHCFAYIKKGKIPFFGESFITTQFWSMYAPSPPSDIGYFELKGWEKDKVVLNISLNNSDNDYPFMHPNKLFSTFARNNFEKNSIIQNTLQYWLAYECKVKETQNVINIDSSKVLLHKINPQFYFKNNYTYKENQVEIISLY